MTAIQYAGGSIKDALITRSLDLGLVAPHPNLRSCVVVPARNEEAVLPALIAALAAQRNLAGAKLDPSSFEVIVLVNNCSDSTASVGFDLCRQFHQLHLHIADVSFDADTAHVGRARQALFDVALARFEKLGRPNGLILTTDADSRPATDWIAQTEAEIAKGVVGVGGRITLHREETAELQAGVRKFLFLDIAYRRAMEELRWLYAPEAHDPFPRHHQHFGASFAVTAAAYVQAGGMPLQRSSEDVALYRAIIDSGGRFRHSAQVRVQTSARMVGRAQGGLADALDCWDQQTRHAELVLVESAADAEARLARLGLLCAGNPGCIPPSSLIMTPDKPLPGQGAEIGATLHSLREICASLRPITMTERLNQARYRFGQIDADVKPHRNQIMPTPLLPKSLLEEPERHPLRPAKAALALGSTVIVAPHPDDETLGCGGLLALLAQSGIPTKVLLMTNGSRSHPNSLSHPYEKLAEVREGETINALTALGVSPNAATFLRYGDGELPQPCTPAFGQTIGRLRDLFTELEANTVLVPWRRDPHDDHKATWHLLRSTFAGLAERPRWLEYPIWAWQDANNEAAPSSHEACAWRLDISSILLQKQHAIAQHRSQLGTLIHDDPEGFVLRPEMISYFVQPWELFIEPNDD